MALHLATLGIGVTTVAGVAVTRFEHTLLQADQTLHQLEGRTRGIVRRHRAVIERAVGVLQQFVIVQSQVLTYQIVRIVGRRRHHQQDLARRRLDRHNATNLTLHQLLGQLLQLGIDRADQRATGNGQRVVHTVAERALDHAVCIDLIDLHALLTAQYLLVSRLQTADTDVVARTIFGALTQLVGIDLAHITHQVAANATRIGADRTIDRIETSEITLVETQFDLLRELIGDHHRHTRASLGASELLDQLRLLHTQHAAHTHRVETLLRDLARDDHQVVRLTTLHDELAIAVAHLTSRRILHNVAQSVVVGHILIAIVDQLNIEQSTEDHTDYEQHDHLQRSKTYQAISLITHNTRVTCELNSCEVRKTTPTVTTPLTTVRSSVRWK